MELLGARARDIEFRNSHDLYEAIGFLCKPGVLIHFEAQVPDDKVDAFTSEFPGQYYYPISINDETVGGYKMKTGIQLRLYLGNIENIPLQLSREIVDYNRINRGFFAYNLLKYYGFKTGRTQNERAIRSIILNNYSEYITDFDRGFSL